MRFKRKIANAKIYEDKCDLYCTSRHWPGCSIWHRLTVILIHHRDRVPRLPHHQRFCHGRGRLMHRLSQMPPATTHWYPPGNQVLLSHDNVSWAWSGQCRHFFRCTDSTSSVFGVCGCTCIGPVSGSSLGRVVTRYGPSGRPNCCGAIAAGCRVDGI